MGRLKILRPKIRADCANVPRPCPFASCRHNMFLEVTELTGRIKVMFPQYSDPSEMSPSNCVLDLIDARGEMTLEDAGKQINVTRERARQITDAACRKLRDLDVEPEESEP